jgi:hypothetical protein
MDQRIIVITLSAVLNLGLPAMAQEHAGESPAPQATLPSTGGCEFNSEVAMDVYALVDGMRIEVGQTPAETPLEIPECDYWVVHPMVEVDFTVLCEEIDGRAAIRDGSFGDVGGGLCWRR